jgi:hypothetical protein
MMIWYVKKPWRPSTFKEILCRRHYGISVCSSSIIVGAEELKTGVLQFFIFRVPLDDEIFAWLQQQKDDSAVVVYDKPITGSLLTSTQRM